jgi:diguanylate cyclase (GGDEF)-like protein
MERADPPVTSETRPILSLYLGTVILAAGLVIALQIRQAADLLPGAPAAFGLFAALALGAEMRPLRWLGPSGKGEVTASWTFMLALFMAGPFPTAALTSAAVMLLADAPRRQPLRTLFNAAQVSLSLMTGVICAGFLGYEPQLSGPLTDLSVGWVAGGLFAGAVAFALNSLFTCVAIALSARATIWHVLRSSVGINMSMDLMLIGLAPAFGVVARANIALGVLLAATVWAIYKTSDVALTHRHEATHDLLTSLCNRRSFAEQSGVAISMAARHNQNLAVLQIDLDGFKGINDRLGHAVGDAVLQAVSDRIREDRRSGEVVARLGGDEFAILFPGPCSLAEARTAGERILATIRRPLILSGVPLSIDASIGVAEYPTHGEDLESLLVNADSAMYRAKKNRGGVEAFSDAYGRSGPSRMSLVGEVTRGLEREEFDLVYQPKLDLATNRYVGVEALLRWHHPERGLVLPDSFIPTAEQTDLIQPITDYVVRRALKQCAAWQADGLFLSMSVNVSARNLHSRDFARRVTALLEASRVDATSLELEITENTVMLDPDRTAMVLTELRQLGMQVSIDDFGTGFSSLANLRTLPVDRVKIDKSFVVDMLDFPRSESIVRSIIDLARNLGLGTIAEGVESPAVLDRLRELGCDMVQGYLTGRPIAAEAIRDLCRSAEAFATLEGDARAFAILERDATVESFAIPGRDA